MSSRKKIEKNNNGFCDRASVVSYNRKRSLECETLRALIDYVDQQLREFKLLVAN